MKTIYKYEIELVDNQSIEMPKGAEVLSVQVQNNKPCLWAIVETERPTERKLFKIAGTGNPFDTNLHRYKCIGTFQLNLFVWHLFELYT